MSYSTADTEWFDGKPRPTVFQQQSDAVLSQANPVSATLYTVLDTTSNVRIISIESMITWAVTQPTPFELVLTVDGISHVFTGANPISATPYYPQIDYSLGPASGALVAAAGDIASRSFFMEGRSVKVEVRITWAVTQPTPLVCRVKYAKIP